MNPHMMKRGLLISDMLEYSIVDHPNAEIVSRLVEDGSIHRYTQKEAALRAKQLANALKAWGVNEGDRVATMAWNNYRHYEIYFGVIGIGAVCHTLNPRLVAEQIDYIVNHAEDRIIFVDLNLLPILEAVADKISRVEAIVVMTGAEHMPSSDAFDNLVCYEDFIAPHSEDIEWPDLDEDAGCSLCYTSGTTGNPKGVMYTHRSTVMHALNSLHKQVFDLGRESAVLPVVPMFHVNCWGIPFAVAITGAKLIFPGAALDGASLWELIDQEKPDLIAGVPTVWLSLLNYLDSINAKMESVETVLVGGAAAPVSMVKAFDEKHDAYLMHGWGMTEMSPLGTVNPHLREMDDMPKEERYQLQAKQGRPPFGVELKIIDDEGNKLPHDGKAFGRLMVRGPWIIDTYYKAESTATEDGWFDTGDVANISPDNYMQIVDRKKDVIKSGGEWISSIDLENVAVGHPAVQEACVIGIAHEKWSERPLLLIVLKEGQEATKEDIIAFLEPQVAKFWLPDDIIFRADLPHGATGKLLKNVLRDEYGSHYLS